MPVSEDYLNFVIDQLSEVGEFTQKRMFGGVGFFHEARMFGAIMDDIFRLKVNDGNREDFTSRGMGPHKHGRGTMPYYEVPVDVLENKTELAKWSKKAIILSKKKK